MVSQDKSNENEKEKKNPLIDKKKNEEDKNVEDDEEDDDDYNPEEDKLMQDDDDDDNEDGGGGTSASRARAITDENYPAMIPGCTLSHNKRKAVDEAFQELFGYPFGTRFLPKRRRLQQQGDHMDDRDGTTKRFSHRVEDMLISIFGPATAAQLIATSESVTQISIKRVALPVDTGTRVTVANNTVVEVKKYAGQTITVRRKVNASDVQQQPQLKPQLERTASEQQQERNATNPPLLLPPPPPRQGLDSLLQELNGPGKLSTVAKTSSDWDTFKTEAGVEDEVEKQAQGKNAFLHKQDFLTRVDQRRFDQEKMQRDEERRKRGK